jgi:hypothetical protein
MVESNSGPPPSVAHPRISNDNPTSNGHGKVKPKVKALPPPKPKAKQVLATDRITCPKQLDILRAYAIASGPENKPVTNTHVAALVKMQPTTVSMANAFFTGIGFLQKTDAGFLPSQDVVNFHRAYEWNPESAPMKLAPLVERSWFMQALLPRLRFQNSMEEREAIELLAEASAAGLHHRNQLQMLLDYGEAAGLIQRENGIVKINKSAAQAASPPEQQPTAQPAATDQPKPQGAPRAGLAGALFPSSADGMVQFHISVRVNMAEFAGWQPDRISSFFAGIAQVLAARGKSEGTPEVEE